ncbi:hypothetical protein H5410_061441 [Solanum commersonii]|uniref:Uncharacterized protein n=1 Tax=Solanum commersonii TaxID=4109 RepID=A0A9J5W7R5_SOLCO|nr:hypothetical protein H5410_061441 [Solanum commersonii]
MEHSVTRTTRSQKCPNLPFELMHLRWKGRLAKFQYVLLNRQIPIERGLHIRKKLPKIQLSRFLKTWSQIETIQAALKESIPIKGTIKIGVYDNRNVFIDIYNEEDFKTVYFKHVTEIDG